MFHFSKCCLDISGDKCYTGINRCPARSYPSKFFIFQCKNPSAFGEELDLDCRQGMCGIEIPLCPPAERKKTKTDISHNVIV